MSEAVRPLSQALGKTPPTPLHAAQEPTEVVTSAYVLQRAEQLMTELDAAHEETQRAAEAFADAEQAYELAFATARLMAEGKEGDKQQQAIKETSDLKRKMTLAQELLRSAKKAEDHASMKCSLLQTAAANARAEMALSGRIEPSDRTG